MKSRLFFGGGLVVVAFVIILANSMTGAAQGGSTEGVPSGIPVRKPTYAALDSSPIGPTAIAPGTPGALAAALDVNSGDLVSASIDSSDSLGTGIGTGSLSYFPRQGNTFVILSTGLASSADDPNSSGSLSYQLDGLNNSQGNDLVRLILQLRVPNNRNCLNVDFAFFSEEFTEFVGSIYNDTFTGEYGGTNLSISGNRVIAPLNFAFDTAANIISINTIFGVSQNTGTTYDGGTPLLTARRAVPPGSMIKVVFSVQDLGDSIYDSAVFLDNLRWTLDATCPAGANLPPTVIIEHVEVTQSVQCLESSECWNNQLVPLIREKPTFVRLYIKSLSGDISGVKATLNGIKDLVNLGPIASSNTVRARTNGGNRAKLGDTLYFRLPDNWVNGNSLTLNAMLNCSNCTPGSLGPKTITFASRAIPIIRLKPIRLKPGSIWLSPNVNRGRTAAQLAERAYPTSHFDLDVLPSMDFTECRLTDEGCFQKLFVSLGGARVTDNVPREAVLYGLVHSIVSTRDSVSGQGHAPSRIAWGKIGGLFTYAEDFNILAHEIGHAFGALHVTACEENPDYPYPDYPWADGHIGSGQTGGYGFDVSAKSIHPHTTYDIMTYCSFPFRYLWISDFVYAKLYNGIGGTTQVASTDSTSHSWPLAGNFIMVSGILTPTTGIVDLFSSVILPDRGAYVDPSVGAYVIEVRDSLGTLLVSQNFSPTVAFESTDQSIPFVQVVPWPATAKVIRVVKNASVLAEQIASSNSPSVTILSPNGGETLSGTVNLIWQAQDLDLDMLHFFVQYSVDDGLTWSTLHSHLVTTTVEIDTPELAGSSTARLRVIATDGVNTAQDDTNGTIVVSRKPPVAEISGPASGSSYVIGNSISLQGSAYDLEDGIISEGGLIWSSDINGILGSGSTLVINNLVIGHHLITLAATDTDGNTVQATTAIEVANASPALSAATQPLDVTISGLEVVTMTIVISSTGTADLEWTIVSDAPWLKVSPTGSILAPDESQTVNLIFNRTSLCNGFFTTNLVISSNDPIQPAISLLATLNALPIQCTYFPLVARQQGTSGFDSQFNSSASGWIPHSGSWGVDSSYYSTVGLPSAWATASYAEIFSNFDYQVRLWRNGCDSCSSQLIVRGTPSPPSSDGSWYSYYIFQYTRDGRYSVWRRTSAGGLVALQNWTTTPAIYKYNAWNTLRVVANGMSLYYYINGFLVWYGTDSTLPVGRVGIGMYRLSTSTGDSLYVDWATLTPLSSALLNE